MGYVRGYAEKIITQSVVEAAFTCPSYCIAVYREGRVPPVTVQIAVGQGLHVSMAWLNLRRMQETPTMPEALREAAREAWIREKRTITAPTYEKALEAAPGRLWRSVRRIAEDTRGLVPVMVEQEIVKPLPGMDGWRWATTVDAGMRPVLEPDDTNLIWVEDYKCTERADSWTKEKADNRVQTGIMVYLLEEDGWVVDDFTYRVIEAGDSVAVYHVRYRGIKEQALADAQATAQLLENPIPLRSKDCATRCPFGGNCLN